MTKIEQLYGILQTLVVYDLRNVKDQYTREKIIDAKNIAQELFRDELRAPHDALTETISHDEVTR